MLEARVDLHCAIAQISDPTVRAAVIRATERVSLLGSASDGKRVRTDDDSGASSDRRNDISSPPLVGGVHDLVWCESDGARDAEWNVMPDCRPPRIRNSPEHVHHAKHLYQLVEKKRFIPGALYRDPDFWEACRTAWMSKSQAERSEYDHRKSGSRIVAARRARDLALEAWKRRNPEVQKRYFAWYEAYRREAIQTKASKTASKATTKSEMPQISASTLPGVETEEEEDDAAAELAKQTQTS
jgi:hypothetical protein